MIYKEVAHDKEPAHPYQQLENLIHIWFSPQIIQKTSWQSKDKYFGI